MSECRFLMQPNKAVIQRYISSVQWQGTYTSLYHFPAAVGNRQEYSWASQMALDKYVWKLNKTLNVNQCKLSIRKKEGFEQRMYSIKFQSWSGGGFVLFFLQKYPRPFCVSYHKVLHLQPSCKEKSANVINLYKNGT